MPSAPDIRVLNTPAELFQAAAEEFTTLAAQAVTEPWQIYCRPLRGLDAKKSVLAVG